MASLEGNVVLAFPLLAGEERVAVQEIEHVQRHVERGGAGPRPLPLLDVGDERLELREQLGSPGDLALEIGVPLEAASDNPFHQVPVKKISGVINVSSEPRSADITTISIPKLKYEPGETVAG